MLLHALDDAVLVQEVHLVLRRMDVHVDVLGGDLQTEDERQRTNGSLIAPSTPIVMSAWVKAVT